jgi:hypothetical protein
MNQNQKSITKVTTAGVVLLSMNKIIGTFVDIVPQRTTAQKVLVGIGRTMIIAFVSEHLTNHFVNAVEETSEWWTKNVVNKELTNEE